MGLECLQIARLSGAGRIITVDVRDEACAISRELGADHALNANDCDVVATIRELTDEIGADVVVRMCRRQPEAGAGRASHRCYRRSTPCVPAARSSEFRGLRRADPARDRFDCASAACAYLFPDISTQAHLAVHRAVWSRRDASDLKPTITHVLSGIESVPHAFEITANKGKYKAINPAQVMMCPWGS